MAAKVGKDWVLILGQPVAKRSVWFFLIASALCALGGSGLYYYFSHKVQPVKVTVAPPQHEVQVVEPASVQVSGRVPRRVATVFKDPLKALIARHIAATGYDKLTGFLIRGEYQREGAASVPLVLMGRQPRLYKQVLEFLGRKIEAGYTDRAIWGNDQQILPTEGDSLAAQKSRLFLFLELSIPALGWLDLSLPLQASYELLPDEEWNGRTVSVISDRSFQVPVLHYIDVETALEVRRAGTIVMEDGGEYLVEVVFAAPAAGLPFSFPSGYECRVNGKLVNSVKFTKYDFDKWLPDILFKRKESASPAH